MADDAVEAEKAQLRAQIEELRALRAAVAAGAGGPATLGSLVLDVLVELVDEEIFASALDMHRTVRLGLFCPCSPGSAPHK
jgi:hypothetical protein